MDCLTLHCPAKINLRLKVVKKRPDGYHEIETIFQKISLYDEIILQRTTQKGFTLTVDTSLIPSDTTNLISRAASLLIQDRGAIPTGVSIHLKKKIPVGAGLGGGSSNAALTLLGLNRLLGLGLTREYLQQLAAQLGADVPFFVSRCTTAYATGIGEKITPLELQSRLWFLIVYPDVSISTAWAYSEISKYNLLTKSEKNTIFTNSVLSLNKVISLLENDFERVVEPEYPEVRKIKENIMQAGAAGTLLSGSGSSVFGVFATKTECQKALTLLPDQPNHKAFTVHSL